jgi:hypothetical protein
MLHQISKSQKVLKFFVCPGRLLDFWKSPKIHKIFLSYESVLKVFYFHILNISSSLAKYTSV